MIKQSDRIDALIRIMATQGLDVLAVFSPAMHHVDWGDAVALLTGFKPIGDSMAVLHADGALDLHVSPGWDRTRAERLGGFRHVRGGACLNDLLGTALPSSGKVGLVDLGMMAHPLAETVLALLAGRGRDVTALVQEVSAVKTETEIANARIATDIAERTLAHCLEIARPGIPAFELAAELRLHSRALGADDNFMMFHVAPNPVAVQPATCRLLEPGDMILAEVTPSYRGQFTQVCRTVTLGSANSAQTAAYDLLVRAMSAGIALMAPGVPICDVAARIDEVLTDGGYGDYCGPQFMNRRGHGLGLSSLAPGDVSLRNDTVLEEGMFMVVHPNQFIPEAGYMLCGEPVLITAGGHEVLTCDPARLLSIPC
jgi:Xaa-Pro dipeptidase